MPASAELCFESFWRGLLPDPLLTVSEWADERRILSPKASSEHGPWRTARTPYLRKAMNDLSATSKVREVVMVFGAQLGKSESLNNWRIGNAKAVRVETTRPKKQTSKCKR